MAQTDKRIRWFHYSTEDAKAAQAELDQLAAEGWELAELGLLTATFRPASSPRPCWVEPARWRSMGRKDTERRADYLELCDEAGWDLLDESGGLWFFQAKPGTGPAPVQTDGTVEWTSVWKKILFNQAFNLLFLGIFWTLHFWVQFVWKGFFLWEPLLSNTALGATVLFQVLLLAELIYGAYLLSYRRRCRRAVAAGESFPVPGRWGARLRGVSKLGAGAVLVGAFLLLLTGVGEGQAEYLKDHAGYTRQRRSVFAEQWTYRQFQSHGSLWVESYTCRFSWLAELICGDLLALEGDGEALEKDLHYHAPVTPAPAELGFDRAWTYHDGELSGLILQNGTQVVRIEAPDIDLTNPDILIELRQRILKLTE